MGGKTNVSPSTVPEKIKAEWAEAGPGLFNAAYEASGPDKHEVEEMVTDAEYEARVVLCAVEAWSSWTADGRPTFAELDHEERIAAVTAALDSERTEYGAYRGDLPTRRAVKRALLALGYGIGSKVG